MNTNLVLDEELDTLDGSGSSLRDGGGDTTHYSSTSVTAHDDHCNDLKGRVLSSSRDRYLAFGDATYSRSRP